ncbi:hypothetical protein D3C72_2461200 [compost metagenome]
MCSTTNAMAAYASHLWLKIQKFSACSETPSGKLGIRNRLNGMEGISSTDTETSAQPDSGTTSCAA